jgi:REP element-mobilizing transposase RayT
MPRQARLDSPGTLHHVIIRGIEKKPIIDGRIDQIDFVDRMGQCAIENDIQIFAWALMTNHAHILLKSGKQGLSKYMRRFLTGYALNYNKRHKRFGHLFQNRYKSIVCEEDAYFKELVRYIHLNPVRAKLVKTIEELERYPFCGHTSIMGKKEYPWQERKYVLKWFGRTAEEGTRSYLEYLKQGFNQGKRPELVGGGLTRTLGGWSKASSIRKDHQRPLTDERILGGSEFVEKVIKEADEKIQYQVYGADLKLKIQKVVEKACKKSGINPLELRTGSRRAKISAIRFQIAVQLLKEFGIPLAEIGRQLGITTSSVSKMLSRKGLN